MSQVIMEPTAGLRMSFMNTTKVMSILTGAWVSLIISTLIGADLAILQEKARMNHTNRALSSSAFIPNNGQVNEIFGLVFSLHVKLEKTENITFLSLVL